MASIEQLLQKQENKKRILASLRRTGKQTRRELTRALSLSWACVFELSAELIDEGLLAEEKGCATAAKGRVPTRLGLSADRFFLGLDVNRIGIHACLCTLAEEKRESETFSIDVTSAEALESSIIAAAERFFRAYGDRILGIGVAMQGIFDRRADVWHFPGAKQTLELSPKTFLEQQFSVPVAVGHDPDCIALSLLTNEDTRDLMVVRVDEGVGLSVRQGGAFFEGGPLELGYTVVDASGRRLGMCVTRHAIERSTGISMDRLINSPALAKEHAEWFFEIGQELGRAVGNLSNLLSAQRIVFCGEVMRLSHDLMAGVIQGYEAAAVPKFRAELCVSEITDAAYGAMRLMAESYSAFGGKRR